MAPEVCVDTNVKVQNEILAELRKLRQEMHEKFESQQVSLAKFESTLTTVQKDINNLICKFSSMYEDLEEFKKTVTFFIRRSR